MTLPWVRHSLEKTLLPNSKCFSKNQIEISELRAYITPTHGVLNLKAFTCRFLSAQMVTRCHQEWELDQSLYVLLCESSELRPISLLDLVLVCFSCTVIVVVNLH